MGSKKLVLAFQLIGMGWYVGGCIIGGALLGRWIASLFTNVRTTEHCDFIRFIVCSCRDF